MITLQAFFGLYLEGFLENDPVLTESWAVIKGDHWSMQRRCKWENPESSPMFCQRHHFIWSHKENVGVWQQEGQPIICSNTPLHEDCYGDVVLYQGCTYCGYAATSSFPRWLFTKYFFADDKINYERMIPAYLAEISALETTNPTVH